jgi:hypothetical protein
MVRAPEHAWPCNPTSWLILHRRCRLPGLRRGVTAARVGARAGPLLPAAGGASGIPAGRGALRRAGSAPLARAAAPEPSVATGGAAAAAAQGTVCPLSRTLSGQRLGKGRFFGVNQHNTKTKATPWRAEVRQKCTCPAQRRRTLVDTSPLGRLDARRRPGYTTMESVSAGGYTSSGSTSWTRRSTLCCRPPLPPWPRGAGHGQRVGRAATPGAG